MHYTLHQLRVFVTISECSSITRAAELLHLTQPAVSIQLRNFQDQFEIPLTEILGRKLHITEFGKAVAESARHILEETERIRQMRHAYQGLLSGKIRIASVSTGKYVLPYLLQPFLSKHQGIELEMDVTNKERVLESLSRNAVDFTLMSLLPDRNDLEHIAFQQNELVLVGSEAPPSRKKGIPQSASWILREKGSATRTLMEAFLNENGLMMGRSLELTSNEAVKQAVMAGLGFSIVPRIGIRNELQLGQLYEWPVKGLPIRTQWHLVWLKGKQHSPAALAFKNYVLSL